MIAMMLKLLLCGLCRSADDETVDSLHKEMQERFGQNLYRKVFPRGASEIIFDAGYHNKNTLAGAPKMMLHFMLRDYPEVLDRMLEFDDSGA